MGGTWEWHGACLKVKEEAEEASSLLPPWALGHQVMRLSSKCLYPVSLLTGPTVSQFFKHLEKTRILYGTLHK